MCERRVPGKDLFISGNSGCLLKRFQQKWLSEGGQVDFQVKSRSLMAGETAKMIAAQLKE